MAGRNSASLAAVVFAALCGGCGTEGDASSLPDKWPRTGLSGYTLFNADAPLLLSQAGVDLDEPTAMADSDGKGLIVWGRLSSGQGPAGENASQLFFSHVTAPDKAEAPAVGLEATLPWEGAGLRSPSLVPTSPPLLFYQGEDGSIGVAREGGGTFKKLTVARPLLDAKDLAGPDLHVIGKAAAALKPADGDKEAQIRIYYTLDNFKVYVVEANANEILAINLQEDAKIGWIQLDTGLTAENFAVPPGDIMAVPGTKLEEISVRRVKTPALRGRWDLFAVVSSDNDSVLSAASAYETDDPHEKEHFTTSQAPLIKLDGGKGLSPLVTTLPGRALLLFGLREVQTGIAAAVLP